MIIKRNKNAKYTGYFSHHIRGKHGVHATDEDMQHNCDEASRVAHIIQDRLGDLDLHVPADHDEFVCIAYRNGKLTEDDILEIDCAIIQQRQMMIAYSYEGHTSRGMQTEIACCLTNAIPLFCFENFTETVMNELIAWYTEVCYDIERGSNE